ncbi:hypothetical protein [Ramlibacter rhizophilus]|uniref:Uncharacterized protein n=1 Tax=Ramlibacter rhizophilus TaxID=1781167 RepID=A0A4Z0BIU5_9BURK|nr:hypothetical protein [Ramlibacter rhizophilus]TFY98700.1 hypothetical protein EZ242_14365 [Ramlibacter rhizophilus]
MVLLTKKLVFGSLAATAAIIIAVVNAISVRSGAIALLTLAASMALATLLFLVFQHLKLMHERLLTQENELDRREEAFKRH